jgi:hypothetical protein
MSSSMALIASNILAVNSSADFVAIVQLVGRSNATTRTCLAVRLAFSFSQSPEVNRDSRSTCSTRRMSSGCESARSRNSSGRANLVPLSFSTYQAAIVRQRSVANAFQLILARLASCSSVETRR